LRMGSVADGYVEYPGDAEPVLEHAVKWRPAGWRQRLDQGGAFSQPVPEGGKLVGVGAAYGDEECAFACVIRAARGNVEGHDAKTLGALDMSPSDVLGLLWREAGIGLTVGYQRGLAAKDRLVEGQRRAGLAAEIEVGGGGNAHGDLLACSDAPAIAGSNCQFPTVGCDGQIRSIASPVAGHACAAGPAHGSAVGAGDRRFAALALSRHRQSAGSR